MNHQQLKQQDITFGLKQEKKVIRKLKRKYEDIKSFGKDKYSPIDFISHNHKICFELKSTDQECLKSYRFGKDKHTYYRKNWKTKGYKFCLVYNIKGNIVYRFIKSLKTYEIITWGRTDRGKKEIVKKYVKVNREDFKVFQYQFQHFNIMSLDYFKVELDLCMIDD